MQTFTLSNGQSTATFSPYGAQVLTWQVNGTEHLWAMPQQELAKAAEAGKAMRGGVPLCWPWFGPYAGQLPLPEGTATPQHGWARISLWQLKSHTANTATLTLDATSLGVSLTAEYTVTLQPKALELSLTTTNTGVQAIPLGMAFHTYLNTPDVAQAYVEGLAGRNHIHLPGLHNRGPYQGESVNPLGQDDYYGLAEKPAILHRPGLPPVRLEGGNAVVVWTADAQQMAAMNIMPDVRGNPPFACLEAVLPLNQVVIAPGAMHTFSAIYALDRP